MKWYIALWIACLWACNPIHGVKVSGDLLHYKGDKLYFEICGQDTTIIIQSKTLSKVSASIALIIKSFRL